MNYFLTVHIKHSKLLLLAVICALFTSIFIYVESEQIRSVFSSKQNPNALYQGNADREEIAITFNISWGYEKVEPILEVLKKHDVKSTFFVSGEWAERHPDLLEMIVKDRHEIGMLGYAYKSYLEQEPDAVRRDLARAKDIFGKLGYPDITLLRTPNGEFNEEVFALAENQGLKVIHWSVNPHDWKNPGTDNIVKDVKKNTSNGDIILLHASDSVKQTEKALDILLPFFKEEGLKPVTVSDIISQADESHEEL
ncbi:polysaccharide deacetylase family sporulation protein PdaB [Saliterribacillus persicus]|uniref:Polysaccharide deacetylase family sporulation protein PdaB n=1 Tax=Saliterribacillus persicus TaxID=930114 RepID=A0A368X8I5_9BACI|nr:polysaccharide deacetylase family sporulation protein PdaB [Saliterribacillus persicus]RCW63526.1 polysaccharide deacetylase family sporulation protein PdaB [Saliterribacillus persicus]